MYDWLRMNLDGKPRDLNIARAMVNLDFERKGEVIRRDFISKPVPADEGPGWKKFHLPTHCLHYYDVWRYYITTSAYIETNNKCHVLNLVEGEGILVETRNGMSMKFSYAETFAIPAAAGGYSLSSQSGAEAVVVIAFIK